MEYIVRIMSAYYIDNNGIRKEIFLRDMTIHIYKSKLRGKLFCPMNNCPARISFSGGKFPHFRTWRYDEHAVDCLFYFDRIPMNLGRNTIDTISVEISHARRKKALDDAFILMNLSEEEKEARRNSRITTRMKERKITKRKQNNKSVQQVLFDADFYEDELIYRRRNISKRMVDEITEKDLGGILLIMGNVKSSKEIESVAEIIVENNNRVIKVVFEEAFTAEPLNSSYLNKFWTIKHLLNLDGQVQFTGIGEIRKSRRSNRLELAIYNGTDFHINGKDMSALATKFTLEAHRLG